jgi:hypothetical protein
VTHDNSILTPEQFRARRAEWDEVRGAGPAVVLRHGGLSGAATWSALGPGAQPCGLSGLPAERRGHARAPDVGAPLTYDVTAQDPIAYLEAAVGGPARLAGETGPRGPYCWPATRPARESRSQRRSSAKSASISFWVCMRNRPAASLTAKPRTAVLISRSAL